MYIDNEKYYPDIYDMMQLRMNKYDIICKLMDKYNISYNAGDNAVEEFYCKVSDSYNL